MLPETMRTPARPKLLTLELSRFIAALIVVLAHADLFVELYGGGAFGGFFNFGIAGVDFFFVLSGFIIFHVHRDDIGHREKTANYVWRRFRRVYPLYIIITLVSVIFILIGPYRADVQFSFTHMLSNLTMIPRMDGEWPIISPAWTLSHELLFYALMALLIASRRAGLAVLALWTAGIAACAVFSIDIFPLNYVFAWLNMQFLMGMGAALLLHRLHGTRALLAILAGFATFAAGVALKTLGLPPMDNDIWYRVIYGLGAAGIIAGCAAWERDRGDRPLPAAALMAWLGGASYALYLVHYLVLEMLHHVQARLGIPLAGEPQLLVYTLIATMAGLLTYRLVDRRVLAALPSSWPAMRLRLGQNRLFRALTPRFYRLLGRNS